MLKTDGEEKERIWARDFVRRSGGIQIPFAEELAEVLSTTRAEGRRTGIEEGWNEKSLDVAHVALDAWPQIKAAWDRVMVAIHEDPEEAHDD